MTWTTPADIRTAVHRRWLDGTLLRAYASGEAMEPLVVPLRRPGAGQIAERFADVRSWIAALEDGARRGARYRLEYTAVGGRSIGRNQLPSRAVVDDFPPAWALLGVGTEVARFDEVLSAVAPEPTVRAWVHEHPLRALTLHPDWAKLVAAYRWLDDHRGEQRYLREISAPGVDTKFAERHRGVLGQLLGVPGSAHGFRAGLGLRAKPEFTRLRPDPALAVLGPVTELAVRHEELPQLAIRVDRALIVENEITYLSVPIPEGGIVLWGKGFDVDRAGSLPWLGGAEITYWGDLDTHGFAILNRLRFWLPQTRSILMDEQTLLAHRERWGTEDSPTSARLDRLTPDEEAVYTDLVEDRFGPRVRLEQERVTWDDAARALVDV